MTAGKFHLHGISRNVTALALVSFFADIASEMLYPVIPLFLTTTLGTSPALLGLIEGIAEGVSSGLRWIGGVLSDRSGRRKPFVVAGYGLAAISKPIMGAAAYALGWPLFLLGRACDRLGKTIRSAPRDALIADSTDVRFRGRAFGFHRAMDSLGAVIGPLIALGVLFVWPDLPLASLFLIAIVPGLLSVLVASAAVHEVTQSPRPSKVDDARSPSAFPQRFPASLWRLLLACAIFSLGASTTSFLLLRAKDLGLSFSEVILAYAAFNLVYALGSFPLGHLSDRVGRKKVVAVGWTFHALVYAGLALTHSAAIIWLLLPLYGLYMALTDGVTKAMVTDLVPSTQRASALGWFATVSGLGQLAASVIAGLAWESRIGDADVVTSFAIGAIFPVLAIPILSTVRTHGSIREATDQAQRSAGDSSTC